MKVAIAGGTGLIGRVLVPRLLEAGHEITVITRSPDKAQHVFGDSLSYLPLNAESLKDGLRDTDAIINLAGENIGQGAWTAKRKSMLRTSRIGTTEMLVSTVVALQQKPSVFLQGSAIGYYGSDLDKTFTENDPKGEGFLADLTADWEEAISPLEPHNIRQVIIRTGVVLSAGGGFLRTILPAFRLFVGGPLGTGNQWISWIHVSDEAEAIKFLLENNNANGTFNLCSPRPVKQREFAKTLGKAIHRPYWLKVPKFALKVFFGERTEELLLVSQRVSPSRLMEMGYEFSYTQLGAALKNLLK